MSEVDNETDVEKWVTYWSQHWFMDDAGRDRLQVHGIDAGWATHVDAYHVFMRIGRAQAGQEIAPDRSLLTAAKRAGHDRAARALAMRLLGVPNQPSIDLSKPQVVWILSETPTPSMLEPSLAVARQLGEAARPAVLDPRAYLKWRKAGFKPVALTLSVSDQQKLLRDAARQRADRWAAIERSPPTIRYGDSNVTREVLSALRRALWRSLPWIGPEAEALRKVFGSAPAQSVIFASDQHRLGRIGCQVASACDLRTVVLQHGLPQSRIGYVPVVADSVATWSDDSARWFMERGTDPERLVVTGNPRLDRVHGVEPELSASKRPKRVLLALSPTEPRVNEGVTEMVLSAAMQERTDVIIKLHPGQRDWGSVLRTAHRHPWRHRLTVQHREPIYPLIQASDVVVIHRSTVAIESLALGRPVVIATHPGALGADRELAALRLPRADSSHTLAPLIRLLADSGERARYLAERAVAIQRYVGPMDGRAAVRIAELALKRTAHGAMGPLRLQE